MSIDVHEGMSAIEAQQHGPEVGTTFTSSSLTPSGIDYAAEGAPTVAEAFFPRAEPEPAAEEFDADAWAEELDVEGWDDGSYDDPGAEVVLPDGRTVTRAEWDAHVAWATEAGQRAEQEQAREMLERIAATPGGRERIEQVQARQALGAEVATQLAPLFEPMFRAEAQLDAEAQQESGRQEASLLIDETVPDDMPDEWRDAIYEAAQNIFPEQLETFGEPRLAAEVALQMAANEAARLWAETRPPEPVEWRENRAGDLAPYAAKMDGRGLAHYNAATAGRPASVTARWIQDGRL